MKNQIARAKGRRRGFWHCRACRSEQPIANSRCAVCDSERPKSKYRAKRTSCGLHEHASKKEAKRCGELQALHKLGEIIDLKFQPEYDLCGVKYRADFEYEERESPCGAGKWRLVVEDCKGFKTAVYRIKKKLMKNIHGIEIRES